jgi:trigger factor
MQVKKEELNPTKVKLTVTADKPDLEKLKQHVLEDLSRDTKVPGFRAGKAPAHLIEKQLDQTALQTRFLDEAVNHLYSDAVRHENIRVVAEPQIAISKFVPFSTLEFTAEVEVVGDIKLGDYKRIKLAPKKVAVTAKDIADVLDNLRERGAAKQEVKRAAKTGDEVMIDFTGTDAKTKESIDGADGKDYPLVLGSKTFIPGFEEELAGLKPGDKKTFELTFPADYGTASLQNRKVSFAVTATKVQELSKSKLDDAFAASLGPFKTLAELKADIKKQVTAERQRETQQAYDNELLEKIAAKSTVAIPPALVESELDHLEEEEKRNIAYRGQTWQEHLDAEGLTEEAHREQKRASAEQRIKAGLILGEVAEKERVANTPEELEIRIQLLKGQYTDPAMQAELDKPENRRDINSRMLTEKTLDKLREYASKPTAS